MNNETSTAKQYIGDGVYVEFDGYHLILTVPGGSHSSGNDQRIAMEPAVLRRLLAYRDQIAKGESRA